MILGVTFELSLSNLNFHRVSCHLYTKATPRITGSATNFATATPKKTQIGTPRRNRTFNRWFWRPVHCQISYRRTVKTLNCKKNKQTKRAIRFLCRPFTQELGKVPFEFYVLRRTLLFERGRPRSRATRRRRDALVQMRVQKSVQTFCFNSCWLTVTQIIYAF